MSRTTKDTPEAKKQIKYNKDSKSLIKAVKEYRTFQKLANKSEDKDVKKKHLLSADRKARRVDSLLNKLAA